MNHKEAQELIDDAIEILRKLDSFCERSSSSITLVAEVDRGDGSSDTTLFVVGAPSSIVSSFGRSAENNTEFANLLKSSVKSLEPCDCPACTLERLKINN